MGGTADLVMTDDRRVGRDHTVFPEDPCCYTRQLVKGEAPADGLMSDLCESKAPESDATYSTYAQPPFGLGSSSNQNVQSQV